MKRYPHLVFDLYGTLVDIHTEETEEVWRRTALFYGYHGAEYTPGELCRSFREKLRTANAAAGADYESYPDTPFPPIFRELFAEKGVTADTDALAIQAAQLFRVCSTDYIRLYPGVLEALAQLRRLGHRLWLLSNAQACFTRSELQHLGLLVCFDGVYLSSDFGCRKPDPRFFNRLLQTECLCPGDCLMIGNDRDTDIAGARAVGMDTLYLHTKLTPSHQLPADPRLHPALTGCGQYELEGAAWAQITQLLTAAD